MEYLTLSTGQKVPIDGLSEEPLDYQRFFESLTTGTKVHVKGSDCDGNPIDTDILIKFDQLPFLCLVSGGILPPHNSQAADAQFLLDRNVINSDKRLSLATETFDRPTAI